MSFKKIVVIQYDEDGRLQFKTTLTCRTPVAADSFKEAKKIVMQTILTQTVGMKNFSVEWQRDGFPEGYIVTKERVPK